MASSNWTEPEMVDAIYQSDQVGATEFISRVYGANNRRMRLGQFANGDSVRVPVADVVANPTRFLAPCGKAYVVQGATVVNPCGDAVPDEPLESVTQDYSAPVNLKETRARLVEMFGTDTAPDKLQEAGYLTPESLENLDDETLHGIVGKTATGKYRKYLDRQAKESEVAVDEEDAG